jgi:2,3-bisphosphoglycerate-independent phosphoglycerate mutase
MEYSVPKDSTAEENIRSFLEAPGNEYLFSKCPFRPYLGHLHEVDVALADIIVAHMLGHIIDYRAGETSAARPNEVVPSIPQDNLDGELRYVYNDCNNATLNEARKLNPAVEPHDRPEYQGVSPEQRGCHGADARAELMAEAIRAYMQDPNYIKTVAPNVAARIRAAVNPNPNLKYIIQFN